MPGNTPQTWEAKHQQDFAAIHAALAAVMAVDLSGTGGPTTWLETVRKVREKVTEFQFFIPNAAHFIHLLDTAEKMLLGALAVANLAMDADAP